MHQSVATKMLLILIVTHTDNRSTLSHCESFLEKLDSLGLEYYLLSDLNFNLASLQYELNTCRLSYVQTDATTPKNFGSCWPTMLRPFARS